MTLRRDMSISEIAQEHTECMGVIQSAGVVLCNADQRTPAEVCGAEGDASAFFLSLDRAVRLRAEEWPERDWPRLSTASIVGYLIERHHEYIRQIGPVMLRMTDHLARMHRDLDADHHARELFDTLTAHIDYEEHTLFPTLMMQTGRAGSEATRRGLKVMHADHHEIETALAHLLQTSRRGASFDACITRRVLARELDHLERDLARHSRVENDVLMTRFA